MSNTKGIEFIALKPVEGKNGIEKHEEGGEGRKSKSNKKQK